MRWDSELSAAQRRIWRVYRNITIIFAIVNGLCTSYAFLYIKYRLESAGGSSGSILDNLLFILIASMVFELFAEPITGDWADAYGRRRALVGAFVGLALSFLCYWMISAGAVSGREAAVELQVVIGLALAAEFLFSLSAALFNGALDAWFVDELRLAGGPPAGALLGLFSLARRWFGVFMVAGGAVALWLGSAVVQSGDAAAPAGGLTALTSLPWPVAAGITVVTALWIRGAMVERRTAARGDEPVHRRIWLRLGRALSLRPLRNALVVTSVLYSCWISFAYLLPILLTERRISSEAGVLQVVLTDYYWFHLAMGTSRFIGPYLSTRMGSGSDQRRRFRWWGALNCGTLAAGGIALLLRGDGTGTNTALVSLALLMFWVTKIAEEAFKPVRATYLNQLVMDDNDRAFVLSMATPAGAVTILIGVGLLALARRLLASLDEVHVSVPLLFAILGGLGVVLTVTLSRTRSRDTATPACRATQHGS